MKVFISWSGKRSQALAQALHEWIPLVLQYVDPWVSETDISAGDRWALAVASELEASNFGIICITPENLSSEWVLFEAGALAKSMQDAKVIPLLFGLEFSDITGPLSQFQAKKVDQDGITEVIQAINAVAENKTSNETVKKLVPALWSQLENSLENISDIEPSAKSMRPTNEILEELVTGVRGLEGRLREFDVTENHPRYRKKGRFFHPMMLEELMHMGMDEDEPTSLLMIAGVLRDELPWLSEIILEIFRDINLKNYESAKARLKSLRRFTKRLRHEPFREEFLDRSKDTDLLLMELPMIIERAMDRYEHIGIHEQSKIIDLDKN